jgi:hypothetical protein
VQAYDVLTKNFREEMLDLKWLVTLSVVLLPPLVAPKRIERSATSQRAFWRTSRRAVIPLSLS